MKEHFYTFYPKYPNFKVDFGIFFGLYWRSWQKGLPKYYSITNPPSPLKKTQFIWNPLFFSYFWVNFNMSTNEFYYYNYHFSWHCMSRCECERMIFSEYLVSGCVTYFYTHNVAHIFTLTMWHVFSCLWCVTCFHDYDVSLSVVRKSRTARDPAGLVGLLVITTALKIFYLANVNMGTSE